VVQPQDLPLVEAWRALGRAAALLRMGWDDPHIAAAALQGTRLLVGGQDGYYQHHGALHMQLVALLRAGRPREALNLATAADMPWERANLELHLGGCVCVEAGMLLGGVLWGLLRFGPQSYPCLTC
jgi:hypothetical protein